VTIMRISYRRTALAALAFSALTSFAQEGQAPPQDPAQAPQQSAPGQQRPSPPAEQRPTPPAEQRPTPPLPPSQRSGPPPARPGDDVFIPTEELAADEEVTFPVDI
jgi:hypothetical protein